MAFRSDLAEVDLTRDAIIGFVDACPQDFLDTDFDDIGEQDMLVNRVWQDILDANHPAYGKIIESFLEHPKIQEAFEECKVIVKDYKSDMKEWEKGPMHYNGMRQSDFI